VLSGADGIGELAEQAGRRMAIELERLVAAQPAAGPDLFCDRLDHL
jgi:hypothetical protein